MTELKTFKISTEANPKGQYVGVLNTYAETVIDGMAVDIALEISFAWDGNELQGIAIRLVDVANKTQIYDAMLNAIIVKCMDEFEVEILENILENSK